MALGNIAISITIDQKFIKDLNDAEKKVNDATKKIADDIEKNLGKDSFKSPIDSLKTFVTNFDAGLKTLGRSLQTTGQNIRQIGQDVTLMTAPIAIGFGLATKSAIDFEEGMADIAKTTGATGVQLLSISDGLKKIASDTRTSIDELQKIAIIGGQLGVPVKDIVSFTDAVNKLNVALGDEFVGGAEEISNAVGILRNNFRDIKTDKIDADLLHIGNAINELGASGLATGPVIVDFAQRISGLTSTLGESAGDILGLSATLQELGVNAERGGSAIGRIFQKMATDTEKFAKIAGLSLTEFENLVNTDINGAFIKVLQSVNNNADSATEFAAILDDLGLKGVGTSEVFQKLGKNLDLLKEKQDLASNALTGTGSILDEYNKKNNTTAAQLGKLSNNFKLLGIEIGDAFLPIINGLVSKVIPLIQQLTTSFKNLSPVVQQAILVFGTLLVALGPLLIIVGQVISAVGLLATTIGTLGTPLIAFIGIVGSVIGACLLLDVALLALAQRFGLLDAVKNRVNLVFEVVKVTIDNIRKAFEDPAVKIAIENFKTSLSGISKAIEPLFTALIKLLDTLFNPLNDLVDSGDGLLSVANAVKILSGAFQGLADILTAMTPAIDLIIGIFTAMVNSLTEKVKLIQLVGIQIQEAFGSPAVQAALARLQEAMVKMQEAFDKVKTALQPLFDAISKLGIKLGLSSDFMDKFIEKLLQSGTFLKILVAIIVGFVDSLIFIVNAVTFVINAFGQLKKANDRLIAFLPKVPGKIVEVFNSVKDSIIQFVENTKKGIDDFKAKIQQGFSDAADNVKKKLDAFVASIREFFTVTIPTDIGRGIEEIKRIWDELPKKAEELGFKIGKALGSIITFFVNLPGEIQKHLIEFLLVVGKKFTEIQISIGTITGEIIASVVKFFQELPGKVQTEINTLGTNIANKFNEIKTNVITNVTGTITSVQGFFNSLPGKIEAGLTAFKNSVTTFFQGAKDDASKKTQELSDDVGNTISTLPDKVGGGLAALQVAIGTKFTELVTSAFNFGASFVGGIVNGMQSVGSKIQETVGGFFVGLGKGLGLPFSAGGLVPDVQRFAKGGTVRGVAKTLYAAKGAFADGPKGTDTVPAWLTPGELVLPTGLVSQLFSTLKKIGSLPGTNAGMSGLNASKLTGGAIGSSMSGTKGVNINIANLNASSAQEGKARGGDLGWGVYANLRAKGII